MQTLSTVFGGGFLAAGVIGLVAGADGTQLGDVGLSTLLTVIDLGFGVTGLLAARTPASAHAF